MEQISVKLSEEQNLMVGRLSEKYRCTRAEAVRKAIELASDDSSLLSRLEAKIDAIGAAASEILRLLSYHAELSAGAIKNTRLWVQQAVFWGGPWRKNLESAKQRLSS